MILILTTEDLTKSIADIRAESGLVKDFVKTGLLSAVKSARTVWLFDNGRFTVIKGTPESNPLVLKAGQSDLVTGLLS